MRKSHGSGMFYREGDMNQDSGQQGIEGNEGHKGGSVMVDKDLGYERLLEQFENEPYQGSKNFKTLFLVALTPLRMHVSLVY